LSSEVEVFYLFNNNTSSSVSRLTRLVSLRGIGVVSCFGFKFCLRCILIVRFLGFMTSRLCGGTLGIFGMGARLEFLGETYGVCRLMEFFGARFVVCIVPGGVSHCARGGLGVGSGSREGIFRKGWGPSH